MDCEGHCGDLGVAGGADLGEVMGDVSVIAAAALVLWHATTIGMQI